MFHSLPYVVFCVTTLLHLSLIQAAPTPSSLDPGLSSIQNGNGIDIENLTAITQLISTTPGHPLLLNDSHHVIHIPGSTVFLELYYFPHVAIDRTALQHTLFNAEARFRRHLLIHGNGPLSPDPYQTPRVAGENATMTARSSAMDPGAAGSGYKMTVETLLEVSIGLFGFLFKGNRHGSVVAYVSDTKIAPPEEHCGTVAVRPYGY